jgi:hypothetical protein
MAGWRNVNFFPEEDRILQLYKAECSGIFGTTQTISDIKAMINFAGYKSPTTIGC